MFNQTSTRPQIVNNQYSGHQLGGVNIRNIIPQYSHALSGNVYSEIQSGDNLPDPSLKVSVEGNKTSPETEDVSHIKFRQVKPICISDCDLYGDIFLNYTWKTCGLQT